MTAVFLTMNACASSIVISRKNPNPIATHIRDASGLHSNHPMVIITRVAHHHSHSRLAEEITAKVDLCLYHAALVHGSLREMMMMMMMIRMRVIEKGNLESVD